MLTEELKMKVLNDEELLNINGGSGFADATQDMEACKADCENRLAGMQEMIIRKCISNCIKKYRE